MKPKLELFIFIGAIIILVALRLPLASTDIFIVPFAVLILIRLGYLIKQGELSLKSGVFDFRNSKAAIASYFVFSVAAIFIVWLLKDDISLPVWFSDQDWLWLIALQILFQEIIFRTYLINRLRAVFHSPFVIALTSGAVFGFMHFILPDAFIVVILGLISGIIWSLLYLKYPNLLYVWLSHLAINLSINFVYIN